MPPGPDRCLSFLLHKHKLSPTQFIFIKRIFGDKFTMFLLQSGKFKMTFVAYRVLAR